MPSFNDYLHWFERRNGRELEGEDESWLVSTPIFGYVYAFILTRFRGFPGFFSVRKPMMSIGTSHLPPLVEDDKDEDDDELVKSLNILTEVVQILGISDASYAR